MKIYYINKSEKTTEPVNLQINKNYRQEINKQQIFSRDSHNILRFLTGLSNERV